MQSIGENEWNKSILQQTPYLYASLLIWIADRNKVDASGIQGKGGRGEEGKRDIHDEAGRGEGGKEGPTNGFMTLRHMYSLLPAMEIQDVGSLPGIPYTCR